MTVMQATHLGLKTPQGMVLQQISVAIKAGDLIGIIGPNGAGKSSLLRLLAGIVQPDAGIVLCMGKPIAEYKPQERARLIAWLEQRPVLHWPLSVEQVVALGRLPYNSTQESSNNAAVITRALEFCGITTLRERLFPSLSEGEKLLVNLARVLATNTRLILADEPTSALDPRHQIRVMQLLQQLADNGTAVAVVLHDLTLAVRYCKQLLLLDRGNPVAFGTPEEVLTTERLQAVYGIKARFEAATHSVVIDGLQI